MVPAGVNPVAYRGDWLVGRGGGWTGVSRAEAHSSASGVRVRRGSASPDSLSRHIDNES